MLNSMIALSLVGLSAVIPFELREPVPGHLLVTVEQGAHITEKAAFIVAAHSIVAAPKPKFGTFDAIDWGATPAEVFITACEGSIPRESTCHVEKLSLDGTLLQTYPKHPVEPFVETDGRLTNGSMASPVRLSASGAVLALNGVGRNPAFIDASTGGYLSGMQRGMTDFAWSPHGQILAYTRASDEGLSAAMESQLFLFDLEKGTDTQVTHFPPKTYGDEWWRLLTTPVRRPALIAGVSWAKGADLILFFVVPDRGLFLLNPHTFELTQLENPKAPTWRLTQLSNDGTRILFVSASRSLLNPLQPHNEIRMMGVDGSMNQMILRTSHEYTIIDADWWSD